MDIHEKNYKLNGTLTKRKNTDTIILHHRAGYGDVESIDTIHKNNGWSCIGYHFYVRLDGSIYRGRQEDAVGAHAYGHNATSIGICAEGNFETYTMNDAQKRAIVEVVKYIKSKYPITSIIRHRDVCSTACPGRNYPFNEIVKLAKEEPIVENNFVKEIQNAIGAKVDGIVGNETMSKLPVLSKNKNNRHKTVKLVQKHLIELGYTLPKYGADGIFGNEMTTVVKQFQKNNALVVDGIIGKNTWKKLLI